MSTNNRRPKIVVIGGGSGSSVALRGLKKHDAELTSVVTTFDSGGSSGILREEFGHMAFGDLRQCLLALSDESESTNALRAALNFRFRPESSLNGHSVGNLLLSALTSLRSDAGGAIEEMSRMLNVTGKVHPVALETADLCAELEDGTVLRGESSIDLRGARCSRVRRVFLDPQVDANPKAIEAVLEADAVVLGPGDLFTSVVPNLLVGGMQEAIRQTRAICVYPCNLMTKPGETDGFKASDFTSEITKYMGGRRIDWILLNTRPISRIARRRYADEGATPVETDREVQRFANHVLAGPYCAEGDVVRHDQDRLAEAILTAISSSSSGNSSNARLRAAAV